MKGLFQCPQCEEGVGLTDRERTAFPIYTYFPMQHVDVADS